LIAALLVGPVLLAAPAVFSQYTPGGGSAPYQPAVPSASESYGGYGGGYYYGGGTTAAGSAMQGMASVVNAAGNYNLSTSAAAVNMTQAQKQGIENYNSAVTTYYQTREMNQAYQKSQRGPPPSAEQLNRLAQKGAPKPLESQQLDLVTGQIAWPELLKGSDFSAPCAEMQKAFAWRAHYGAFNYEQLAKVEATATAMLNQLKGMVKDADPMAYSQAKNFIESLAYAARQPA
jgi:hypothetical protein